MRKSKRESVLSAVLVIGVLWGGLEATLGALLHLLPVSLGFLVWSPLALGCMLAAFRQTGTAYAPAGAALVCALLKLMDFALPIRPEMVVHPAISILAEGLACSAMLTAFVGVPEGKGHQAAFALCWNTAWRALNLFMLCLEPAGMRAVSVLSSGASVLKHIGTDNLLSCLGVMLAVYAVGSPKSKRAFGLRLSPAAWMAVCAGSLLAQRIL